MQCRPEPRSCLNLRRHDNSKPCILQERREGGTVFRCHGRSWNQENVRLILAVIIFTGELFFRADGLKTGIHMFLSIFKGFRVDNLNQILMSGLDKGDYAAIIIGTVIVFAVGILKEKNIIGIEKLQSVCLPVRWIIYYGLIFAVIIFGAYGIGYQQVDLIYAGF